MLQNLRLLNTLNEDYIMALSRSEILDKLKLANPLTQYDEMLDLIQTLTPLQAFSKEERDLFGLAAENYIQSRIKLWSEVSSSEQKSEGSETRQAQLKDEREKIEADSRTVLETKILPVAKDQLTLSTEATHSVFFNGISGNAYAFLASIAAGDSRQALIEGAQRSYGSAFDQAKLELNAVDPQRLYVALNFSQFYYDILDAPDRACHLAKQAFDDAIAEDVRPIESERLMQRLRDNLTKWTSEAPADVDEAMDAS
jgi:14-3-3 protein beta/theta/zeta